MLCSQCHLAESLEMVQKTKLLHLLFSVHMEKRKKIWQEKSNMIGRKICHNNSILTLPSWWYHIDVPIQMLPSWCYTHNATNKALPSGCYHPDATIAIWLSWDYPPEATVSILPTATVLILLSWCCHLYDTVPKLTSQCYLPNATVPTLPSRC